MFTWKLLESDEPTSHGTCFTWKLLESDEHTSHSTCLTWKLLESDEPTSHSTSLSKYNQTLYEKRTYSLINKLWG